MNAIHALQTQNERVRFQEPESSVDPLDQTDVGAGDRGEVAEAYVSHEETEEEGSRSMTREADQPLPERVKKAPELMKQFEDYIRLMEDRICALEADRVSSAKAKEEVPEHKAVSLDTDLQDSVIRPTTAIPDWTFMSSEEYEKEKGRPVPAAHYAIDIWINKPSQAYPGSSEKSPAKTMAGIAGEAMAGGLQDLPERIRINSNPLKHIVDECCNRGLRYQPGFPLVMQKPYKALVYHEAAIRDHMARLEQRWGPRRHSAPAQSSRDTENNEVGRSKDQSSMDRASSGPINVNEKDSPSEKPRSPRHGGEHGKDVNRRWSSDHFNRDERVKSKTDKEDNQTQLPPGWGRQKDYFGRTYYTHHTTKLMTWTRPRADGKVPMQNEQQDSKIGIIEEEAEEDVDLDSQEAMNDLRCLIRFMDEYIKPVRDQLQQPSQRTIRFSELWHLFQPGQLIYVRDRDVSQKVWRVLHTSGGRRYLRPPYPDEMSNSLPLRQSRNNGYSYFALDCYSLNHDGSRFVPAFRTFPVHKYDDARLIDSLPVFPIAFAERERLLDREAFMRRGQKFVQCTNVCHQYYSGRSLVRDANGARLPSRNDSEEEPTQLLISETIESEVMIDFDRAFQRNPDWVPISQELKTSVMDLRECEEDETDPFEEKVEQDDIWDKRRHEDFVNGDELKLFPWPRGVEPSGDDLLLLPDRVFGFVLRSRKWGRIPKPKAVLDKAKFFS